MGFDAFDTVWGEKGEGGGQETEGISGGKEGRKEFACLYGNWISIKTTKPFSSQEGLSDSQEGFDWSGGLHTLRSAWWVRGSLGICLQSPFYLLL